jgi:hypothetical protein
VETDIDERKSLRWAHEPGSDMAHNHPECVGCDQGVPHVHAAAGAARPVRKDQMLATPQRGVPAADHGNGFTPTTGLLSDCCIAQQAANTRRGSLASTISIGVGGAA